MSGKVSGSIAGVDLHKLGIDPREGVSRIGLDIDADLSARGSMVEGFARLGGIRVENGKGGAEVGDVDFRAYVQDGEQCFNLNSPFVDVFFAGTGTLTQFVSDIQDISLQRHLPAIRGGSAVERSPSAYDIEAVFHDSRDLMSFVMPGLYISDSTRLALSISDEGRLEASERGTIPPSFQRLGGKKSQVRRTGAQPYRTGPHLSPPGKPTIPKSLTGW